MTDQEKTREALRAQLHDSYSRPDDLEIGPAPVMAADAVQRQLYDMLDTLPNTVYETDAAGRLVFLNRIGLEILGYTPEELTVGLSPVSLFAEEDRDRLGRKLAEILTGAKIDPQEGTIVCRDGRRIAVVVYSNPIVAAGACIGSRGVVIDVSAQSRAENGLRRSKMRLERINAELLRFTSNHSENIQRLTAVCGELMGATCALYNRLEGGLLCSLATWQAPPDYQRQDVPQGHICYDVIKMGSEDMFVVRDLQRSAYARSDPNVGKYGLKTYIGKAVKCANAFLGSLCVVFQHDYAPDEEDREILGILTSAIGVEEERRREFDALLASERRYRAMVENQNDAV
jgi:PAS domain S-box-containing protein